MFAVDEATAEAIRRAFNEDGEFSAVVELRRHYAGITEYARAAEVRHCVATKEDPRTMRGG